MSVCLSGVLDHGIVVPGRVSLILIRCLATGDRLIRLLLIGILSAQTDKILDVVVPTANQAQRLRHHRVNFRGGGLIDLRLDGETWRHAGHWFLMCLKVPMILSLSNGYRRAEVRRRRTNIVLLLLNIPVLLLLLLLLRLLRLRLLLLLMDSKILRQTIRTEIVGRADQIVVHAVAIVVVIVVVIVVADLLHVHRLVSQVLVVLLLIRA